MGSRFIVTLWIKTTTQFIDACNTHYLGLYFMHEKYCQICGLRNNFFFKLLIIFRCPARARVGGDNNLIQVTDNHNHAIIHSRRPHKEAKRLREMKRNKRNRNDSI